MKIHFDRLLAGAQQARGTAVIIDVFRAFTCTPLLFSLGIEKSILVSTPQEAFALKSQDQALLLSGEVSGIPIEGFDLGNSPSEILKRGTTYERGVFRRFLAPSCFGCTNSSTIRVPKYGDVAI